MSLLVQQRVPVQMSLNSRRNCKKNLFSVSSQFRRNTKLKQFGYLVSHIYQTRITGIFAIAKFSFQAIMRLPTITAPAHNSIQRFAVIEISAGMGGEFWCRNPKATSQNVGSFCL